MNERRGGGQVGGGEGTPVLEHTLEMDVRPMTLHVKMSVKLILRDRVRTLRDPRVRMDMHGHARVRVA